MEVQSAFIVQITGTKKHILLDKPINLPMNNLGEFSTYIQEPKTDYNTENIMLNKMSYITWKMQLDFNLCLLWCCWLHGFYMFIFLFFMTCSILQIRYAMHASLNSLHAFIHWMYTNTKYQRRPNWPACINSSIGQNVLEQWTYCSCKTSEFRKPTSVNLLCSKVLGKKHQCCFCTRDRHSVRLAASWYCAAMHPEHKQCKCLDLINS